MSAALAYPVLILCLILIQCAAYWADASTLRERHADPLNGDEQP